MISKGDVVIAKFAHGIAQFPSDSKAEAFWRPFFSGIAARSDDRVREMEGMLRANFSARLIEQAKAFRGKRRPVWQTESESSREGLGFHFDVGPFSYEESLLFPIDIVGLQALVTFLYGNPDLVLEFLEICTPDALVESIGLPSPTAVNAPLSVTLRPSAQLLADLGPSGGAGGQEQNKWAQVLAKAQRMPWLLPTVLALGVLFVAFSAIVGERERLHAREAALTANALQLQTAYQARVEKLEALTLELVRELRVPVDKAAECCASCCAKCPPKQPPSPHPPIVCKP